MEEPVRKGSDQKVPKEPKQRLVITHEVTRREHDGESITSRYNLGKLRQGDEIPSIDQLREKGYEIDYI